MRGMYSVDNSIAALQETPDNFEKLVKLVPKPYVDWRPRSWDGVPSETFTVLGQACHLRDIEIHGYHVRFHRALNEEKPELSSIDSYALERNHQYNLQNLHEVIEEFRKARRHTIDMLGQVSEKEMNRRAVFAEYGEVTFRSLIYILCSHDQQHLSGMHWLLAKIHSQA